MKISKLLIENYRGINNVIQLSLNEFNCIVGKNDVGKSTILKALECFLNDVNPTFDDKNIHNESNIVMIQCIFDCSNDTILIDDTILTTLSDEELLDENNQLNILKYWDISSKTIKPKIFLKRKKYDNDDFIMLDEKKLMSLCEKYGISTNKANGEEFNNKEKREKLREYYRVNNFSFEFEEDELALTGQNRSKKIYDAIKLLLPRFEYFKADSSLSDSDTSIQKYFKEKALALFGRVVDTADVEESIRHDISITLNTIADKINSVLPIEEQIEADVNFDWSKIISTSFKSKFDETNIPLSSRGDGFRRITMMSYFEMRAEEKKVDKNVIFGFEEPETFLHPEVQLQLFNKLMGLCENNYQIFLTTHSPFIVAEANLDNIIFITKEDGIYTVNQKEFLLGQKTTIIKELGVKHHADLLSCIDNVKCLLLVEGKDDVKALSHIANLYKENNVIGKIFDELGVHILPIGGCDSIKHWVNLDIIKKLGKPFYIWLDSDKGSAEENSSKKEVLYSYGLTDDDFQLTRKREIECYIPTSYFSNLNPPINIIYDDWSKVKDICKQHEEQIRLGGSKVCDKHFHCLNFDQVRSTFNPNNDNDEFLELYDKVNRKIS